MSVTRDVYQTLRSYSTSLPVQNPNRGGAGAIGIIAVTIPAVQANDVLDVMAECVLCIHPFDQPAVTGMTLTFQAATQPIVPPLDGLYTGQDLRPESPYLPYSKHWTFVASSDMGDSYVFLWGYAASALGPGTLSIFKDQTHMTVSRYRGCRGQYCVTNDPVTQSSPSCRSL